jgi:leukotriene-A4 hydrolase
LHLKTWLYGEGIPDNMPWAKSPAFDRVDEAVAQLAKGAAPSSLPLKTYSTEEWQRFLQNLPANLSASQMRALDETYGLSRMHNAEISRWWFMAAIEHHYEPAFGAMTVFMTSTGCQNYIFPLYRALMQAQGWGPPLARHIYDLARPLYHQITRETIETMLKTHPA